MKTNCPHCRKEYLIDDGKIPIAEVSIRCNQCSQSFLYVKGVGAKKAESPIEIASDPKPQTAPASEPAKAEFAQKDEPVETEKSTASLDLDSNFRGDAAPTSEKVATEDPGQAGHKAVEENESAASETASGFWQPGTISDLPPKTDSSSEPAIDFGSEDDDPFAALSGEQQQSAQDEPSVQPEFGSADDYSGALSGPADDGVEEAASLIGLEPTSFVDASGEDAVVENEEVLELTPEANEESSDDEMLATDSASSNYWDQMQSLSDEESAQDELAIGGSDAPSGATDLSSDEELLKSLDLERQKVKAESDRLDTVSNQMDGLENVVQPAKPSATPIPSVGSPVPPPPPAPEPPATSETEMSSMVSSLSDQLMDQSHQESKPPVKPPRPAPPKARTGVPPAAPSPQPEGSWSEESSVPGVTRPGRVLTQPGIRAPQAIPSVSRKRGGGWQKNLLIAFSVVALVVVAVGITTVVMKRKNEDVVTFESDSIRELAKRQQNQKSVNSETDELEATAQKNVKSKPSPVPEEVVKVDNRPAYEKGISFYQEHNLESYQKAEQQLLEAYKSEDQSERSTLALAKLYAVLGQELGKPELLKKAFKMSQEVLKESDSKAPAYIALAQTYYYSRKYKQAFTEIQRALALDPNNAEAFLIRGMAMWRLGKGGGGLQQAQKAAPKQYFPMYQLSQYYLETKKYSNARSVAKLIQKRFPKRFEGYYLGMLANWRQKRYKSAASLAKKGMELNTNNVEFYLDVGELFLDRSEPHRTIETLELFLVEQERMPRDVLGKMYLLLGKAQLKVSPQKAVFYFEKLVDWNAKNVTALNFLGLAYFEAKQYQASIPVFRKAAKLAPNNEQVIFNLGLGYYQSKLLKNAEKMFLHVLKLNSKHIDARFYLASVYELTGKRMNAIKELNLVVRANPNHPLAVKKLKKLKAGL